MGQNWHDGGRNEDAGQGVDSAVFGNDLCLFDGHIICQNLSLEKSSDIFRSVLSDTSCPQAELGAGDLSEGCYERGLADRRRWVFLKQMLIYLF